MQTFLPYPSFVESARVLDNKRLGKQRVEAYQILKALLDPTYGWQRHPAVLMWKGYEKELRSYGQICCKEWKERGFKDSLLQAFNSITTPYSRVIPIWIGDEQFHLSHQSNLIRKNPEHYRPIFGPDVPENLPYYWPSKQEKYQVGLSKSH